MSKRVAFSDHISVDAVDLSNFSRQVTLTSEHARVDVSGFNPTGADEFLAGTTTQSLTVEFYGSYGTAEVHQTLYPIHQARSIVPIQWRHDQNSPISATNPELRGNVQLLTYNPGATRGDAETFSAEFVAADPAGLAFVTVGPEMASAFQVEVKGYSSFLRACNRADTDTRLYARGALRKVGDVVKEDAQHRFSVYDPHTAAGYKTRVRIRGIAVEQSLRKVTGLRPDYGALQMRKALLPAAAGHEEDLAREMDHAVSMIEARFEGF